jgi:hypothetical protein
VNDGSDSRNSAQAFLQQQRACAKFVIAGAVALFAGDENDLLVGGPDTKRQRQNTESEELTFP